MDALVVEASGGATTSFLYEICVVAHEMRCARADVVANLYGATRSDRAYGVNVRWVDPRHLVIEYKNAKRSTLIRPTVNVGSETISISLAAGVMDASAPDGGMAYSKRKPSN